jgi:hypothetical protein
MERNHLEMGITSSEFAVRIFTNKKRLNLYRWDGHDAEATANYEILLGEKQLVVYKKLCDKTFNKVYSLYYESNWRLE